MTFHSHPVRLGSPSPDTHKAHQTGYTGTRRAPVQSVLKSAL